VTSDAPDPSSQEATACEIGSPAADSYQENPGDGFTSKQITRPSAASLRSIPANGRSSAAASVTQRPAMSSSIWYARSRASSPTWARA
jgi:hypothetical protein